jgi:hypothetical protein
MKKFIDTDISQIENQDIEIRGRLIYRNFPINIKNLEYDDVRKELKKKLNVYITIQQKLQLHFLTTQKKITIFYLNSSSNVA